MTNGQTKSVDDSIRQEDGVYKLCPSLRHFSVGGHKARSRAQRNGKINGICSTKKSFTSEYRGFLGEVHRHIHDVWMQCMNEFGGLDAQVRTSGAACHRAGRFQKSEIRDDHRDVGRRDGPEIA